jgi:chitodextrinase
VSRYRTVGTLGIAAVLVCGLVLGAAPASAWPTRDRTPPTTPSNLRITASTPTSVSLAWNQSTDNASRFWYCVQTNGSGCVRVDPPRTTITYPVGLPETTFSFSVYAIDSAGNRSASSNAVSFTTPPDTTPPSPAPVISVASLTPTGVVLTWPEPVDDFSQVYWTLLVNGDVFGYADRLGPPTQTLLGLTPETSYTFQVSLRDRAGNSVTGPPLVVTTPARNDAQAPTAPTGLRASSPDGLDLRLFWSASTDNADPQSQIHYDVHIDGVRRATSLDTNTWMSCESADTIEIFVTAVDTSGNVSAPSNTVIFDDCNP